MRNLITALMLSIGIQTAYATEYAATNKGGGEMRLTEVPCKNPNMSIIYSFSKTGQAMYGCWFYKDQMVHVTWSDGDSSIFPAESFREVKKTKPQGVTL